MRTPRRSRPTTLSRFTPLAAALASALAAQAAYAACTPNPVLPNPVYCVTNTNPGGPGSLLQAFSDAASNCTGANATIGFDLGGTGPFTIAPSSTLELFCFSGNTELTIDGEDMIEIDGSGGIEVGVYAGYGATITVKNTTLQNFTYSGSGTALMGQVRLYGSTVRNNYYGVNAAGETQTAHIGGPDPSERNVFTGNSQAHIRVCCENSDVVIENNLIGTPDGASPGGGGKGIWVETASDVEIRNNVISGTNSHGIVLAGAGDIIITGNKIGTTSGGNGNLGNAGAGIHSDFASAVLVTNNTIAFNAADGIVIPYGGSLEIRGNRIFDNGVKAINLGNVGSQVPNDPGDGDGGPNGLQNFPVINSVVKDAANNETRITWELNSTAASTFAIDFFSNTGPSAAPQARNYLDPSLLGFTQPGGSTGPGNFTSGITTIPGLHDFITATATHTGLGETSEVGNMALAKGLALSPQTINFGDVVVLTESAEQVASLSSLGSDSVTMSFVGDSDFCYGGQPICSSGGFICSTTCEPGTPYAAGPACTLTATFAPFFQGTQSTTVRFCSDGGEQLLTLTGNGVPPPPAAFTPSSHNFGNVTIGGQSALQVFTITNPAPWVLTLSPPTVVGPFSIMGTTCTSELFPEESCTVDVKFLPVTEGPAAGLLEMVTDDYGGMSEQVRRGKAINVATASLSGNGTVVPSLVISPSSHDFGTVLVGQASPTRAFSIQNSGATTTPLTGVTASSGFEVASTDCGSSLGPAASCVANVRFRPAISGFVTGTVSATGAGGTSMASVSGTGSRHPTASVPTDLIEFGALVLNTDPAMRAVTLRNTGNATLAINNITVSAPYTVSHDCPVSLAEGASCEIRVTFNPTALGDFPGLLNISTNAPGGTSIPIQLHAAVQPRPEPVIRVNPSSIGFGARLAGSASPTQTVTIRNEGGAIANLSLALNMPHFSLVNTSCGPTLAPLASCSAELAFVPQGFGPKRANLVVTSNSPGSPATVNLSGAGCRPDAGTQSRGGGQINCSP